jgi:hypothetical protein
MYELFWKTFGAFVFIYAGLMNLILLLFFIFAKLYVSKLPWSIIMERYKKHIKKLGISSLIGLSAGFMTYTSADILAKVYNSWIHYISILILFYIFHKYKLLPFTDNQD